MPAVTPFPRATWPAPTLVLTKLGPMSQGPDCLLPGRQLHPKNRLRSSAQLQAADLQRRDPIHCKDCLGHCPESHAPVSRAYASGICCHPIHKAIGKTQTRGTWARILGRRQQPGASERNWRRGPRGDLRGCTNYQCYRASDSLALNFLHLIDGLQTRPSSAPCLLIPTAAIQPLLPPDPLTSCPMPPRSVRLANQRERLLLGQATAEPIPPPRDRRHLTFDNTDALDESHYLPLVLLLLGNSSPWVPGWQLLGLHKPGSHIPRRHQ